MDEPEIRTLIDDLRSGACSPDEAVRRLRRLPFAELGFAKVDHHRALRQGAPEAVYGPGKSPSQCAGIVAELLSSASAGPVLLTRADEAQVAASMQACSGGQRTPLEPEAGRLSTVVWRPHPERPGRVLVCTAGTADLAVAEECTAVLRAFGFRPAMLGDCGVAGVHRLFAVDRRDHRRRCRRGRRRHGRGSGEPGGRAHAGARHRRAHERRLRGLPGRGDRPARHARFVRGRDHCRRHRQRLRRRLRRGETAPVSNEADARAGRGGAAGLKGGEAGGRVAWFHCFSGIAGDMALGSLVDGGRIRPSSGTFWTGSPSTDGPSRTNRCCATGSPPPRRS